LTTLKESRSRIAKLSGSPVRRAWARLRAASASQARRLATPVSGSVVAAVRRLRASRPCVSVSPRVATTSTTQGTVKWPGRAAMAPAVVNATRATTCSRAAASGKKYAA
jgi:hypothetical protein